MAASLLQCALAARMRTAASLLQCVLAARMRTAASLPQCALVARMQTAAGKRLLHDGSKALAQPDTCVSLVLTIGLPNGTRT
jgi:hypothetical protein